MPHLLPTSDEVRNLTPAQRERARRMVLRIIRETDLAVDRIARQVADHVAFGEAVRERARELERYMPTDPPHVIQARRQALLEATS